ncbi:hypothetical protein AAVH_06360, partial [Aphelenchoides avenae]
MTSTSYAFNRYFRLFQAITAFAFHSASLCIFLNIAIRLRKTKPKDVSVLLKAFLVAWIVEDLLALPYSVYNAALWKLHDAADDYFATSFWFVIWERAFSCSLPVAVFFLTLDRCLILHFGLRYRTCYATMLCYAATMIVTAATSTTLYIYVAPRIWPTWAEEPSDDSVNFFGEADDWQFLVRVSFGTMNFLSSLIFFLLLRKENAKRFLCTADTAHKKAGNAFVLYAICSEFLLNFLPHASVLAYEL